MKTCEWCNEPMDDDAPGDLCDECQAKYEHQWERVVPLESDRHRFE